MEIPPVSCWFQYSRRTGASVHLLTTSIGESHGLLELDVHPLPPRSALLLVSCPVLPAASLEVIRGAFPTSSKCVQDLPHIWPPLSPNPGQSHHCLHSVAWSTPDCSVPNPSPLTDLQHSNQSVVFLLCCVLSYIIIFLKTLQRSPVLQSAWSAVRWEPSGPLPSPHRLSRARLPSPLPLLTQPRPLASPCSSFNSPAGPHSGLVLVPVFRVPSASCCWA